MMKNRASFNLPPFITFIFPHRQASITRKNQHTQPSISAIIYCEVSTGEQKKNGLSKTQLLPPTTRVYVYTKVQ